MKRGKKYLEAAKSIDRATLYDPAEAIGLAKKAAVAKFDETIDSDIVDMNSSASDDTDTETYDESYDTDNSDAE